MTDEERKLAETEIFSGWLDDASKSPEAFSCSEDEVYRLGLECANLRAALSESKKETGWWKDEWERDHLARHEWVTWARRNGAVATGPDAELEARKILEARLADAGERSEIPGVPFPAFPSVSKNIP